MAMRQTSLPPTQPKIATPAERQRQYEIDRDWALGMQLLAITDFYARVWPGAEVIELDNDRANPLKTVLDIGGADKMLRYPTGGIAFLAQRFRRYKSWHPTPSQMYDDFTLRYNRPYGRMTEAEKLQRALDEGGFVASWYAYGHANEDNTGFTRFRILNFPALLRCLGGQLGDKVLPNRDQSSTFVPIPFRHIPASIFLLDYPARQLPLPNGGNYR